MSRRSRWNPIPAAPPSPKILHFPRSRRTRRKHHQNDSIIAMHLSKASDQEKKEFERRERVEEPDGFQAEMLRAEWKTLLRTERELAFMKLHKNRVKIEGREKIVEGEKELQNRDGKGSKKDSDLGKGKGLQEQVRMKMVEEDDCSASTSKRIDRHLYQESSSMGDVNKCSGRCKAVVRRIVEQVRAETEEWSQMQEMMRQVRGEMEELQASRDYWQTRARNAECQIQSLKQAVEEWKHRALYHEIKANQTAAAASLLKDKGSNKAQTQTQPLSLGKQLAKEKRMRRHAYNHEDGTSKSIMNRSPLKDIGNSCNHLHFRSPERGESLSFRKCDKTFR